MAQHKDIYIYLNKFRQKHKGAEYNKNLFWRKNKEKEGKYIYKVIQEIFF